MDKSSQNRLERHQRLCEMCSNGDIEDEYHFVLICAKYKVLRRRYISNYYVDRPSMMKFLQLLSSKDETLQINLINYLIGAYKIRSNLLNV